MMTVPVYRLGISRVLPKIVGICQSILSIILFTIHEGDRLIVYVHYYRLGKLMHTVP